LEKLSINKIVKTIIYAEYYIIVGGSIMKYYDCLNSKLVKKTPFKKVIKAKLRTNRSLSPEELERERLKYEIAEELGLSEKVKQYGWSGLTTGETGRIGGIMTRRNNERRKNDISNGIKPTW
jgi:hypothetical protein